MLKMPTMSATQALSRSKTGVEDIPIWRRFRRNVSTSVVGSGLSLAIKLGQTALLAKALQISDYGRLLVVLNFFVFLDSFFGLRVNDLIFRFFPAFIEQKDLRALKALLLLCLGACLASGLLIYGGVLLLSPWLADRLYPHFELVPLLRIYGCTVLVSTFSGVYEPILRIHDRFNAIVVPQVLGSFVTLSILSVYFATNGFSPNGNYSLRAIVAAFTVGALVQSVPPFIKAFRLVRPFVSIIRIREVAQALSGHRRAITDCLVNSNLSGYLKFAISPGDVFLLGLFSNPTQIAWYGLARQLTAPLSFLQTNIQTAITPEVTSLVAKQKFAQLKRLLTRYIFWTFAAGSLLLVCGAWLGRLLVLNFLGAEYIPALPVFYLLTIAAWLMLVFLVFRPLALSLDLLRWHNAALVVSAGVVGFLIITGRLNALTMAYVQLAEVLILRSLFGVLVWTRLKRLSTQL